MTPGAFSGFLSPYLLPKLLFLCAMAELFLCLYQQLSQSPLRRRIPEGALFLAALFACAASLLEPQRGAGGAVFRLLAFPGGLLLLLHSLWALRMEERERKKRLSRDSVKQALDNLRSGVLFADESGRVVLINHVMGDLIAGLSGSYPQTLSDLEDALAAAKPIKKAPELYLFPEGRIWRFLTVPLKAPGLAGYTQTIAQDRTGLYEANEQLARENAALKEAIERTRHLLARVEERVREQETLELKIRVHNDIGKSLIALSELAKGGEGSAKDEVLSLRRAVSLFESRSLPHFSTLEEAREEAEKLGASLKLSGDFPEDPRLNSLIAQASEECTTNCIRLAGGSLVEVHGSKRETGFEILIKNDGHPPAGPITEGGGLRSLRQSVEKAGGRMTISHSPRFQLTLEFNGARL